MCDPSNMCGRYVSPEQAAIERAFAVTMLLFDRSYNVAPTQPVPVVRSAEGKREGALIRWGLIPFFARGVPPKYSTINARLETVETSPAYRGPPTLEAGATLHSTRLRLL
jgi:putative SOS response-associated peptidase YedK